MSGLIQPALELLVCVLAIALHSWTALTERAAGASYGGFMINWIEGNAPKDMFKCLVCHAGLFNTPAFYYTTEELFFPEWEFRGSPWTNPELYNKFNPAAHADKWNTPMLVIHGALDYRVPVTEGLAAFNTLQRRNVPSKLLLFPMENHWVLKPQNRCACFLCYYIHALPLPRGET